ncbi:MAG: hypothetical protein ACRCZF_26855 [Gemmataceae bacterium]
MSRRFRITLVVVAMGCLGWGFVLLRTATPDARTAPTAAELWADAPTAQKYRQPPTPIPAVGPIFVSMLAFGLLHTAGIAIGRRFTQSRKH